MGRRSKKAKAGAENQARAPAGFEAGQRVLNAGKIAHVDIQRALQVVGIFGADFAQQLVLAVGFQEGRAFLHHGDGIFFRVCPRLGPSSASSCG